MYKNEHNLLTILQLEKKNKIKGGIYHKLMIEFTYNTNRIEGSMLTPEHTRSIYDTNTIGIQDGTLNVDDIIETANHFRAIDYCIDCVLDILDTDTIKMFHAILKGGTSYSRLEWFKVGDYKSLPNEVAGKVTTPPNKVAHELNSLIASYNQKLKVTVHDIIDFHHNFETIHPFQDGNGRVGRLVILKECLKHNIVPFIISDTHKLYYYRGLDKYKSEPGYLVDTCLSAQDVFKSWLEYFEIYC